MTCQRISRSLMPEMQAPSTQRLQRFRHWQRLSLSSSQALFSPATACSCCAHDGEKRIADIATALADQPLPTSLKTPAGEFALRPVASPSQDNCCETGSVARFVPG